MSIKSVTRAVQTVVRNVEAEAVRPALTQAAQTVLAPGFSTASSFKAVANQAVSTQAASTGSSSSPADNTKKAIEILGKTEGGEALKKLLSSPYLTREESEEAAEAYNKIASSLSPEDAAIVRESVSYETCVGGSISLGKMIMDRLLESLKNTRIIPQS